METSVSPGRKQSSGTEFLECRYSVASCFKFSFTYMNIFQITFQITFSEVDTFAKASPPERHSLGNDRRHLQTQYLGPRGLLVVYVFMMFAPSSSKLSRVVPPCATVQAGHRLQARHKIRCIWDPECGKTQPWYPVSVSIIHLFTCTLQVLYIYMYMYTTHE